MYTENTCCHSSLWQAPDLLYKACLYKGLTHFKAPSSNSVALFCLAQHSAHPDGAELPMLDKNVSVLFVLQQYVTVLPAQPN